MYKKKLGFLITLSFLSLNLQCAEEPKKTTPGRKLCGPFTIEIQKRRHAQHPFLGHNIRIKIIPGEGFSGFGSDTTKGLSGVLLGARRVFFNLPNKSCISLERFLSSLTSAPIDKPVSDEDLFEILNLFFQRNTTVDFFHSFTFGKAFEATLQDGKRVLVLTPKSNDAANE